MHFAFGVLSVHLNDPPLLAILPTKLFILLGIDDDAAIVVFIAALIRDARGGFELMEYVVLEDLVVDDGVVVGGALVGVIIGGVVVVVVVVVVLIVTGF